MEIPFFTVLVSVFKSILNEQKDEYYNLGRIAVRRNTITLACEWRQGCQ